MRRFTFKSRVLEEQFANINSNIRVIMTVIARFTKYLIHVL